MHTEKEPDIIDFFESCIEFPVGILNQSNFQRWTIYFWKKSLVNVNNVSLSTQYSDTRRLIKIRFCAVNPTVAVWNVP